MLNPSQYVVWGVMAQKEMRFVVWSGDWKWRNYENSATF